MFPPRSVQAMALMGQCEATMGARDERQRFAIDGRIIAADDPALQPALARAYDSPSRPRCLCVAGGVEMYVAHHGEFVIKRMPDSGVRHHPACPSFEPEPAESGLGELLGDAVIEAEPGRVEVRVGFAWERVAARQRRPGAAQPSTDAARPQRRLSLRALMHLLFERAGFNRWSPAMLGKRNQAVLHKYLMQAADGVIVKGVNLGERLYVPEPFSEAKKTELSQRRRAKLSVLHPHDGHWPMALVIGEFKACEFAEPESRVWIRHMPDAPLLVSNDHWRRIQRVYGPILEARDADIAVGVRLLIVALIRARREQTYEVDAASLMLASEQWIPLEGVQELPLVDALVMQRRRFVKPLPYDARNVAAFANATLLDVGRVPQPLHLISPYWPPAERAAKERAIAVCGEGAWVWRTEEPMPALPGAAKVD